MPLNFCNASRTPMGPKSTPIGVGLGAHPRVVLEFLESTMMGFLFHMAYLIEASGANRPRKRLRLQRLSSWEASRPPKLVVPGRVSASSASRTGKPGRLQRQRENRLPHDPRLRRSTPLGDQRWVAAPLAERNFFRVSNDITYKSSRLRAKNIAGYVAHVFWQEASFQVSSRPCGIF